jgi:hypothetical protein
VLSMTQKSRKTDRKPKLTDTERHKRFLDTAREVQASDDPKDFDKAFDKVVSPKPKRPGHRSQDAS